MKFFISIGYTNRDVEEVKKEIEKISKYIKQKYGEDSIILDSHITMPCNDSEVEHVSVWYMAKSLEVMCKADKVVFAHDWDKYRGCEIEYKLAEAYHMDIVDLNYKLY